MRALIPFITPDGPKIAGGARRRGGRPLPKRPRPPTRRGAILSGTRFPPFSASHYKFFAFYMLPVKHRHR